MGRRKLPIPQPRLRKDARGLWQVTWTDVQTGKTVRRGCGTRNRREAEERMPQIVEEAMSPAPPPVYTFGELFDAYVEERTQREHSKTFRHAFSLCESSSGRSHRASSKMQPALGIGSGELNRRIEMRLPALPRRPRDW